MTTPSRHHPISRSAARTLGIPVRDLLGGDYQRVFYNAYVRSRTPLTLAERASIALTVAGAGSFVSHHSAALLRGGCPPPSEDIHVSVPDGAPRCERRGICAHRATGDDVTLLSGLLVSSALQCFREMAAAGVGLIDLVVLGDSLVRAGCLLVENLVEAAARWSGRGAKIGRRAAGHVREGVDSPQESRLRMLLVLAGLPEPQVNLIIRAPDGIWRMRFDLAYPDLKIVIEYDGRQHAWSEQQWKRDSRRREQIDQMGWRVITVHSDGIYENPRDTLDRVRMLLEERGVRGVRKRYLAESERYFPGR